ncbi:DUF6193 family natural product biosynthesis protein [Sinosporangium siamense]|uniref:Uncharacterized protein n=1 Tax=Sinosporangium siamense TaxID=1367973 RepID=A0A919RQM3_9ACTN|nr:DUF6193 family natural product biosynthesis protein [Sinosporangium siamense]GII96444.1 hypothetical protein Ssi02_66750 [Sinosporangium siamense]
MKEFYPDLFVEGGLKSALANIAVENGIEIPSASIESSDDGYSTVTITATRGRISIYLGVEGRRFSVQIYSDLHAWASGGTDDLLETAKVVDAWRKEVTLAELRNQFPFMSYERIAEAYESGDPVSAQWATLLDADYPDSVHALLAATYATAALRRKFPYVSHGALCFMNDQNDRAAGVVQIHQSSSGEYKVRNTVSNEMISTASMDSAINAALSLLT